ncbi:F-box/LRR-repeat protein, partial [Trifolium medium]|nr:F-box/LRR-repeat protein [Trifolium medium]
MSSSTSQPQRSIPTEDRISILPDSILCHILSFLPTKLSASTSILSKRWKPLWLSLLHLDFDVQSFTNFNTFRHVVYSVMLSREVTLPIKSLRLKSCSEHVVNDINGFINAAMQRGIEYLDLEITTGKDFELTLTPNIFSCKTLMVLKLKNLNVNKIPTQVHFPLLKILHLDKVLFSCYEDIFKFPLFCPILEDLSVNDLQIRRGSKFISEKFISEASKVKCLPNLVKASFSARLNIPLFLFTWARILRIKL